MEKESVRTSTEMLDVLKRMAESLQTDEGNEMLMESINTTGDEMSELVIKLLPIIALQMAMGGTAPGAFMFCIQVGIALANDAQL